MKKKIIGILVCMLLFTTAIPVLGITNQISDLEAVTSNYSTYDEFMPSEFIVKFTDESAFASPSITALNEKNKVKSIDEVFKNADNTRLDNLYVFSVSQNADILSIVKEYSSHSNVVFAAPNGVFHLGTINPELLYASSKDITNFDVIPDDEYFGIQWALHNTGQNIRPDPLPSINGTFDCDIDAPEAWDIETGSEDIVIAIIDTGIDYNHPDLSDNIWINGNEIPDNGIDDDNNGYIDDVIGWDFLNGDNNPLDDHSHGTHLGGAASAISDNSVGITGVCWNCKLMPVKTFDETGDSDEITCANGIKYAADNGADIISMSFGVDYYPFTLMPAIDYAYEKGVYMCAGAHNYNTSMEFYPAASNNVTAVAATNQNDERCDDDDWDPYDYYPVRLGSNYGDWVDIAAPGNVIYSTMPTYHVYLNDYWNQFRGNHLLYQNYYDYMGGTSMSTPIVAGLAGLILSKDPDLTPDQVHAIICDKGNVDPYVSEVYIGTGRINACKALISMYGDLECEGSLNWVDVQAGESVKGNFTINNVGLNGTLLSWEITDEPSWKDGCSWSFSPMSGTNLSPENGSLTVQVTCVAPEKKGKEYNGHIKIENIYTDDEEYIDVFLSTPKNKSLNFNLPFLGWLINNFQNSFPIMRHIFG